MSEMTPREIVQELDKHIVGQAAAKRAVAIALCGRVVVSTRRDLADMAIKMLRTEATAKVKVRAEDAAEDRVLDALLPPARDVGFSTGEPRAQGGAARQAFRKEVREGPRDEQEVDTG